MTSDTTDRFTNLVDAARTQDAVEAALEAFWAAIVEKYPEVKSGDYDPFMYGIMVQQAGEWLEHWLNCNADRCEDCGKKILSVKDACFEMANMTCVSCFSKKQLV